MEFNRIIKLLRKERGADHAAPSIGYVDVLAAYPCDECGRKLAFGTHVALEVAEQRLTKTIEGGVMTGDLYSMSNLENKRKVNTEDFLREIAKTLDKMM